MAEERVLQFRTEGLRELNSELEETRRKLSEATDPEEIVKLSGEVSALDGAFREVNNQLSDFNNQESGLKDVSNSFDALGGSLAKLDFKGAATSLTMLGTSLKKMSFKKIISGMKAFGKAAMKVGLQLLTNPIFLITATIGAIVVAIGLLLKHFGLLETVLEALMAPVNIAIQAFKDLSDFLGFTNYAAQEAADGMATALEDSADRISIANQGIIDDLDQEIRMRELNGESTVSLEIKKQNALLQTAQAETKSLEASLVAMETRGDASEEELEDLREKIRLRERDMELIKGEIDYIVAKDTKRKEAESIKEEEDAQKRRERIAKEKERQAQEEERQAQYRLEAKRQREDLEVELMEDGLEKQLEINRLKYERLREDTLNSEKLTEEEKIALNKQYREIESMNEKAFRDAKREKDEEDEEAEKEKARQFKKELDDILYGITTDDGDKELDNIQSEYESRLELLKTNLENEKITREEYAEAFVAIEKDKDDRIAKHNEETEKKKRDEKFESYQTNLETAEMYANAVNSLTTSIFELTNSFGKQDEEAKERRAKKQFKIQKALNLTLAAVDGAKAITTSLASSPLSIGGVPNPAGIASLIAVSTNTAASIATILASKYEGGTSSGGGGGTPSPKTNVGGGSPRQIPKVEFKGASGGDNQVDAGGNYTIDNNIIISETEITDKQRTVANLKKQSQL